MKLIHDPSLLEEMLRRARVHDMDKMIMFLFIDRKKAQDIHVQTARHHVENDLNKTYEDLVEAVLDYESAPYTKPRKQLNAFDFVNRELEMGAMDPATGQALLKIIEELGIAYSTSVSDDVEGKLYIESIGEVTENMLRDELLEFISMTIL